MKKYLAFFLALVIVMTLTACAGTQGGQQNTVKKNDYVLSENIKEGSLIDGVMTDISAKDEILQKTTASWLDTCVLYEVNIRQYTEEGTFAAFEEHLDRLKEMGVNTLWLMPIHPISEKERKGTLGSYYAVTDYKDVNPEFGTMDDFRHLLNKAHEMGFKVILDWVANHTGWDCAWITEHDDWYEHTDSGKISSPYNWTDTAELNFDNYEMRAEMIKCMQFWVEDVGVDGFRCDHAVGVPSPFWNAAVYKLKSINSEILMLAEASAAPALTTYAFDSCYNDSLYGQALSVKGGIATYDIGKYLPVSENFEGTSFPMNYLDNHDKNSYEGSIVFRYVDTYQALLALTFIAPGMPLLYTTDEQGTDHELEFFEKDTVKWDAEPKYAGLIAALSKLKTENAALAATSRDIEILKTSDPDIFAFSRTNGSDKVIYVANLGKEAVCDASFDLDTDTATCVIHNDGSATDTTETAVTAAEFGKKSYLPYEFFVLTVDSEA